MIQVERRRRGLLEIGDIPQHEVGKRVSRNCAAEREDAGSEHPGHAFEAPARQTSAKINLVGPGAEKNCDPTRRTELRLKTPRSEFTLFEPITYVWPIATD